MPEKITIIIFDLDGPEEASRLARAMDSSSLPEGTRKVGVAERSDATAAREALAPAGFEVIQAPDGASAGQRKNLGIQAAVGDVVLLSARVRLIDSDWLAKLADQASATGAGVAGAKVVDEAGMILNAGYHVLQPECDLLPLGGGKKDINQYYYAREVEGVDSACMYITRKALEAAGGFSGELGDHYDDLDFCLKVKQAGLGVMCAGNARVSLRETAQAGPSQARTGDASRGAYRELWETQYANRYDNRVMWHSWINAPTGYAVSSQYLVLALEQLNVDVRYGFVYGVEEPPNEDERINEVRRKPKDLDVTQVVYGQGDVFFKTGSSRRTRSTRYGCRPSSTGRPSRRAG
jgi:hypothetical protein